MNKKGFTLIELLIVITIIGILAVAFLPSLLGAPAKARDSQRIASVSSIAEALALGSLNNDTIPTGSGCMSTSAEPDFTSFIEELGGSLPLDPSGSVTYTTGEVCTNGEFIFSNNPDGAGSYSYGIIAKLENADGGPSQNLVNCSEVDNIGETSFTQTTAPTDDTDTCYYVLGQ